MEGGHRVVVGCNRIGVLLRQFLCLNDEEIYSEVGWNFTIIRGLVEIL